ncbi:MAG: response regulator transcription factor [Dysgonamonadaceae bacterium]|jgi:DNA-binding NarL/FixJ family response regulator|nr:response regulator transcription factor [Dysgonamonadaceae bacterium]
MHPFIIADNQYITRAGIISLLRQSAYDDGIIETASRLDLKKQMEIHPQATVVLDYTLFDFSDAQLMNMKQRYPQSLWMLFSDDLSKPFLRQVLQSEQRYSVVMKTDSEEEILAALRNALQGEIYLCETAVHVLREEVPLSASDFPLTASEQLILHEIAMGKTTKEIAYEKNLSFHTVNTHRRNIFRKLDINNVHEATKYALRAGLIDWAEYTI